MNIAYSTGVWGFGFVLGGVFVFVFSSKQVRGNGKQRMKKICVAESSERGCWAESPTTDRWCKGGGDQNDWEAMV